MHDIRVLSSRDMTLCMTLSGHTSTLPRPVVQSHGFEAPFLRLAQNGKVTWELFLNRDSVDALIKIVPTVGEKRHCHARYCRPPPCGLYRSTAAPRTRPRGFQCFLSYKRVIKVS